MKAWWRQGDGTRTTPASGWGATQEFQRMSLDATAITEIAQKMVELTGTEAHVNVSGFNMVELKLDEIATWSPAHLDRISLITALPGETSFAQVQPQEVPPTFVSISLLLNTSNPPGMGGALTVTPRGAQPVDTSQVMGQMTQLITKLGRPVPTLAWVEWVLPTLLSVALVGSLVAAAIVGQLPWLLWPGAAVAAGYAVWRLMRSTKARWVARRHRRGILLLDRRPRKEVDEQRENDRRDLRQRINGGAIGFVFGVALAATVLVLGFK